MHTDLSPHLHSKKCNDLIDLLQLCRKNNPVLKFLGFCNFEYTRMTNCLKAERIRRQKENFHKSKELKEKLIILAEKENNSM